MNFSFNNQTPIYIQIMEVIQTDIISGKYTLGQKLPSVREFAVQFDANPNTIQKALFELEWVGLIVTERTNGKFVTSDQNVIKKVRGTKVAKIIEDFFSSMEKIGINKEQTLQIINDNKEIL